MKTIKHRVSTRAGRRLTLTTDDTLTLAFPRMVESTPATLAQRVSDRSIYRLANLSESECGDLNIRKKATRALALTSTGRQILALGQ